MWSPNTDTPRFRVEHLDIWGALVKSWATRQDYVQQREGANEPDYGNHPPRNYSTKNLLIPPPPTETSLDTNEVGALKPWALPPMSAVLVPSASGGASVALPAAVALTTQEFMDRLHAAGVAATMPEQYTHVVIVQGNVNTMLVRLPPADILQGSEDDLINGKPYPFQAYYTPYYNNVVPTPPTTRDEIMELHAYRIGDYTLSNCD